MEYKSFIYAIVLIILIGVLIGGGLGALGCESCADWFSTQLEDLISLPF